MSEHEKKIEHGGGDHSAPKKVGPWGWLGIGLILLFVLPIGCAEWGNNGNAVVAGANAHAYAVDKIWSAWVKVLLMLALVGSLVTIFVVNRKK